MLTVAYMGGGGCQKWPKTCLRNLRTAPYFSAMALKPFDAKVHHLQI